jgi:hypothetical protein
MREERGWGSLGGGEHDFLGSLLAAASALTYELLRGSLPAVWIPIYGLDNEFDNERVWKKTECRKLPRGAGPSESCLR